MEPAPAIDGADVRLRPVEHRDADAWFAYLSVPEVVRHTSWNITDRSALHALIESAESDDDRSTMRFAIVDRDSDTLIGTIGFPSLSWVHRTAEVAYDLGPAHAGRGIATACCRAVTAWALGERGLVRVQATALDTNLASNRVLVKSGLTFEGTLANLKLVRGEPRAFNLYAATAPLRTSKPP